MTQPNDPHHGAKTLRRHPLAIAWDYWLTSEEGKTASAPDTLPHTLSARRYLENRLNRAFIAGSKVRNVLCGNCGKRYVGPYEEDQHGLGVCAYEPD